MKGLSLWQPWASLMAIGAKRYETRSWSTSYRGLVAIHAAQQWNEDLKSTARDNKHFWNTLVPSLPNRSLSDIPRGCFIALGKLHRVLSTTTHAEAIPSEDTEEFWFGDYSPGRFMWIFDGVWKLKEPVYAPGHQGLWTLQEAEADVVTVMLADGVEDQLLNELEGETYAASEMVWELRQ